VVRCTFSPARAWRPAAGARLARTLAVTGNHFSAPHRLQDKIRKPMPSTPAPVLSLVVYAKDMKAVSEFYTAILDLSEAEAAADFKLLIGPGVELSVVRIPEAIASSIVVSSPPAVREETPLKFSFLVVNLSQAIVRASSAGGSFKPLESAWSWRGMRHLDGHDPEGNVVQLREPLSDG
jgi:predicted enzyme related to lactoylglutathione lyase